MPSNRSILADIVELGLNPTESHQVTDKHGRLVSNKVEKIVKNNVKEVIVEKKVDQIEQDKKEVIVEKVIEQQGALKVIEDAVKAPEKVEDKKIEDKKKQIKK